MMRANSGILPKILNQCFAVMGGFNMDIELLPQIGFIAWSLALLLAVTWEIVK